MASSVSFSDDKRGSTPDANTSVDTLRHIMSCLAPSGKSTPPDSNQRLSAFLKELFQQHMPGVSLEDVKIDNLYKNEALVKLLKEIVAFGRCAKSDFEKCMKLRREERKTFGLTGASIDDHPKLMETSDAIRKLEPLENRMEDLKKSLDFCKKKLQELESLGKLIEECKEVKLSLKAYVCIVRDKIDEQLAHKRLTDKEESLTKQITAEIEGDKWKQLSAVSDSLCDVMTKWRQLEAWMCPGIIAVPENVLSALYLELSGMFGQCYAYMQHVYNVTDMFSSLTEVMRSAIRDQILMMSSKISSIAWCYDKQPPTCYLEKENMDVSVRLLGLNQSKLLGLQCKVYFFPESDVSKWNSEEFLCKGSLERSPVLDGQVMLSVKGMKLKKCVRAQKRGSAPCCAQFYRLCFVVQHTTERELNIECLSLPFTIRSGALQLWECGCYLMCCLFTARNLYTPPFECEKEMTIDKILAMLQALMSTVDPDKIFDSDEITSLEGMLKTLTKTETISIIELVKEPMPQIDRAVKNKPSFFNWFIAAMNTHMFLKAENLRICNDFLSYEQCKAKMGTVPDKSALIRISRNEITSASSKTPYADIVIHNYITARRMVVDILNVQSLKGRYPLARRLVQYKDEKQERLIMSILPYNFPVENDHKEEENENGYRTRTKTTPGNIIVLEKDFENMHVSSKVENPLMEDISSEEVPVKIARYDSFTGVKRKHPPKEFEGSSHTLSNPESSLTNIEDLHSKPESSRSNIEDLHATIEITDEQYQRHLDNLTPVDSNDASLAPLLDNFMEEDS